MYERRVSNPGKNEWMIYAESVGFAKVTGRLRYLGEEERGEKLNERKDHVSD